MMEEEYIRFESKYGQQEHTVRYEINNADAKAIDVAKAFTRFMLAVGYSPLAVEAALKHIVEDTEILC